MQPRRLERGQLFQQSVRSLATRLRLRHHAGGGLRHVGGRGLQRLRRGGDGLARFMEQADHARSAGELDARLSFAPLLRAQHRDAAHFAGARGMRSTARRRVDALDQHHPVAFHRLLAQRKRGALLAGEVARHHRQVAPDALVGEGLGARDIQPRERRVQVDGAGALAEMERERRRRELVEGGGEQVLPVVLLHVIEAARPVDRGGDRPRRDRLLEQVQDGAVALLCVEHLHRAQHAAIAGLPAAFRVERAAVQDGGGAPSSSRTSTTRASNDRRYGS